MSTGLDHLELAARITDLAGLHVAPPTRVLALELGSHPDRLDRPVLPMDPGIANLFDQLDVASRRPTVVHPAACRRFLTRLVHVVPSDRDVHLVCLEFPSALQDWLAAQPRFAASHPGTEALWADEVSQCLGHRGARALRARTRDLESGLRQWQQTGGGNVFTWLRPTPCPQGEVVADASVAQLGRGRQ